MSEGAGRLLGGRYRLLRVLGRGGMGVVWHAHDETLQRDVAVKVVHLPASVDVQETDPIYRRTLREARAAAKLRHPGIVTVHDVISDGGRPCIVMELIEGDSLAQLIREHGPLPQRRAAEIGLRVAHALDAAHRKGILHRDVKPANILLDGERAVLTDFGIAAIDGGTALTATNHLIGSPEYIAPEHIGGAEAGPPADLWALGVTLYAAVAGRSPFQRSDPQTTLVAIVAKDPDPLPEADVLWPIIEGMLNKDPAGRLTLEQTIALLTAAVREPAPAPTPSTVPVAVGAAPTATAIEEPAAQVTVAPDTVAKTRTAPPELPARPKITPAKRTRDVTAIPLILVITLIISGMIYVSWQSNYRLGRSGSDPPVTTSPSVSTAPIPPAPPGYVRHDQGWFSFAVPQNWRELALLPGQATDAKPAVQTVAQWAPSDTVGKSVWIRLRVWQGHNPNARAFLSDFAKSELFTAVDGSYREIELKDVTLGPSHVSVADLEFSYRGLLNSHTRMRVRSLVNNTAGHTATVEIFALVLGTASQLQDYWNQSQNQQLVTTVMDSFQVP